MAEGPGVESRGDGDATSVGEDEFEVGGGGRDRRGRFGQDGDREEMRVGTGGGTIVAGGGLGWAGLVEMLSEGMERDLAPAAELGLSQAAAAELIEEGLPAEIDGTASRHGVVSRRDDWPRRYDHRRQSRGFVDVLHRTDTR
jgi:hypothetical protein